MSKLRVEPTLHLAAMRGASARTTCALLMQREYSRDGSSFASLIVQGVISASVGGHDRLRVSCRSFYVRAIDARSIGKGGNTGRDTASSSQCILAEYGSTEYWDYVKGSIGKRVSLNGKS